MLKFIFRNTTGSFFRTIGRIIAYIVLGFLISILFSKNVNAAANPVTGGMSYFTYNLQASSPAKNGNQAFATTGSTTVYPFSSYKNLNYAWGYKSIQFTSTAPAGQKSALGYTITVTFQVLFDGLQNNMGNTSYTGWAKFNQGNIVNQVNSVELIGLTSASATFKVTSTVQMSTTTSLSDFTIDLTSANSLGYAGWGETFTVQLVLRDVVVQYAENENSAILNSLNRNQQETNKKLDEVKEETKKHTEEQKKTNKKLEEAQETRKGIWETIKGLPGKLLDMLKGLFIPDNFDFLNDFKETLENKLGFIAEVPISIIEFAFGLATATWEEFNSITFPSIEIFGVNFWNSQEISLQEAINIFRPYRYITDVICVVICVRTLRKWYEKFGSGGDVS